MPKVLVTPSESIDNYLKAIFELTTDDRKATTTEIARRLGVSAASVTGMLKKLAAAEPALVTYQEASRSSAHAAG